MNPTVLALIASVCLSASILAVVWWIVAVRRVSQLNARVEVFTGTAQSVEEYEMSLPFSQRFLMPGLQKLGARIASRTPSERLNETRRKLVLAGNPGNLSAPEFMAIKLVAGVVLGPLAALLLAGSMHKLAFTLVGLVMGSAIGYYYPSTYIKRKAKERQTAIEKVLPDSIDLLTISVEAGLAFDLALKRVSEKWDNALSDEFTKVLTDMRLGRPRREALKDMVERTGVEDLSKFVSAIVQAEQLGVGIVQVLRLQADQLRQRRRQRAEEKAHKAPIKIIFPMVLFIFPSIYVVILGPAIPRILESLKGV